MITPNLSTFLRELDAAGAHYSLMSVREGAIMVQVTLPGERWEVEFFENREPEIEIFRSDGAVFGAEKLTALRQAIRD